MLILLRSISAAFSSPAAIYVPPRSSPEFEGGARAPLPNSGTNDLKLLLALLASLLASRSITYFQRDGGLSKVVFGCVQQWCDNPCDFKELQEQYKLSPHCLRARTLTQQYCNIMSRSNVTHIWSAATTGCTNLHDRRPP